MTHHRIAIVGTGFSGLGMAIRLKREGERDFVLLERADDVGGTWRDNTYPGCRCDVPRTSTRSRSRRTRTGRARFSPQPEILRLPARLRRALRLLPARPLRHRGARARRGTRTRGVWRLETVAGRAHRRRAHRRPGRRSASRPCPTSPASTASRARPSTRRAGTTTTTSTGERVAVIGTGASAIQFVPEIQPRGRQAARLPAHRRRGSCRTATGR